MQTITRPNSAFSSVRITLLNSTDKLKALASCTVGGAVIITGIRVVEGKNGLFMSMPQRKNVKGEYNDVAFPASKEMRDDLQKLILDEFKKAGGGEVAAQAA